MSPTHGPFSLTESAFLLNARSHGIEGRNKVGRAVGQISAARDWRLMNVHGIRIFETGVTRGEEVNGNQVIVEENNNGVRILKIVTVGIFAESQKVNDVLLHFENGSGFPVNDRNARRSPGSVVR